MVWKTITEDLRGTAITGLPPQQKTYGEGRPCAVPGCETILSRYNKNDRCFAHTEMTPTGINEKELERELKKRNKVFNN